MDILKEDIRKPIVSGLFYPDAPEELREKTESLLAPLAPGKSKLIMIPHGTWEKAGSSLASAFAASADFKPERILMMGPVHREKSPQKVYLSSKKYFETPLGLVSVDNGICSDLARDSDLFNLDDTPHMEEHVLELGLPFIQILFPDTPIIPLLTGQLNGGNIKKGAARLRKILGSMEKTLVILSANLSRFGPAEETEAESQNLLKNLSMPLAVSLAEEEKAGRISSCGTTVLTLLSASRWAEGKTATLLKEDRTLVKEKNRENAVYYAGVSWS